MKANVPGLMSVVHNDNTQQVETYLKLETE